MHKGLVIFLVGYLAVTSVDSGHWQYPGEKPNGVLEDSEDWGGICAAGKRQSPVDLAHDAAIKGEYPGFIFHNYDIAMKNPQIVNNGHSIQISAQPGPIAVSGGGLPGSYIFDQMHFHWASEHLINNGRYALELHIVHHEKRFESLTKAAQEKNGVAVIGILFHVSLKSNPIIERILENAGTVFNKVGKSHNYQDQLLLQDLLPKKKGSFFRYDGSLTTPGCGEAVIWTVFEHSIPISIDQVERFKSVQGDVGDKLTHNYRAIQPLNSRSLVYVQGIADSSASFKSISIFFLFLSPIISLIYC